jgi:hypothetical protein
MRSLVSRSEPAFKRLTLAGVIIGGVLLFVFGRRREWLELVRVVPVGMGAIFAALLACLWAYPNSWSVTDGLLLGFGMVVVVLAMVPYFILSGGALALEFVFPRAGLDRWRSDDGTASIAAAVGAGWVFPLMVPLLVSVLAYSGVVLGRYALTEAKPSSRADADGRVVPPANGKKWSPDRTRASDFDGDTMSDITLFRPSTGEWWTMRSSTAFDPVASPLSAGTGIVAPGDYDGDGWADVAVFQPGDGSWRVRLSHDSYQSMQTIAGGRNGDIPVPGDYDGDNTTDFAFFRPADSTWHILRSSEGRTKWWEVKFGLGSDVPVPDDYDGDHKTDAAVFRPSTGTWLVLTSSTGFTESVEHRFGTSADIPVPGDYDGDGKADPAVYNAVSGDWQILKSTTNYAAATTFRSQPASIPVPGDYDGDGLTDIAVFQPPIFTWFILKSSTGNSDSLTRAWGVATDIPIFK